MTDVSGLVHMKMVLVEMAVARDPSVTNLSVQTRA